MAERQQAFVLQPGEGRSIDMGNFSMSVKASGDDTSGVSFGRRHCSNLLPGPTSPLASGLTPTTGPRLAEGTTIRSGAASGVATKRSVALYRLAEFSPPKLIGQNVAQASSNHCMVVHEEDFHG